MYVSDVSLLICFFLCRRYVWVCLQQNTEEMKWGTFCRELPDASGSNVRPSVLDVRVHMRLFLVLGIVAGKRILVKKFFRKKRPCGRIFRVVRNSRVIATMEKEPEDFKDPLLILHGEQIKRKCRWAVTDKGRMSPG